MGYLYIIRGGKDTYKVGISKYHPRQRLKQLQTGNDRKLTLIRFYKSKHYKEWEKQIHLRLAYCRVNGEWFNCTLGTILKETEGSNMSRLFGILLSFVYWITIVAIATIVLDAIFNGGTILTALLNMFYY